MAAVLIVAGAVPVQPIAELSRGFAITASVADFTETVFINENIVYDGNSTIGNEYNVPVSVYVGDGFSDVIVTINGDLTLKDGVYLETVIANQLLIDKNSYVIVNGDLYVGESARINICDNSKIIVTGKVTDEGFIDDGLVQTTLQNLVYHAAEGDTPAYFTASDGKKYTFDGSTFTEMPGTFAELQGLTQKTGYGSVIFVSGNLTLTDIRSALTAISA